MSESDDSPYKTPTVALRLARAQGCTSSAPSCFAQHGSQEYRPLRRRLPALDSVQSLQCMLRFLDDGVRDMGSCASAVGRAREVEAQHSGMHNRRE
jgi:hypothetical protein